MERKYVSLFLWALLVWIVPLIISFFMYDPINDLRLPNIYVFKITMFVVYSILVWIAVSLLYRKYDKLTWVEITSVFFVINSLLDLFVLVVGLKVSVLEWLTIITTYAIVLFIISYQIAKNTGRIKH